MKLWSIGLVVGTSTLGVIGIGCSDTIVGDGSGSTETIGCAAGCDDGGGYAPWDSGGDPYPSFPADDAGPGSAFDASAFLPHPDFGSTVTQPTPPPPLSGGTLVVSPDGATAIASDPDRDVVHLVDLATSAVTEIALRAGDEPGRVAIDGSGHAFVALRRGGAVVTIDTRAKTLGARTPVCVAPRGIAFDAASSSLLVACASGELVTLPAAGGAPTRTVTIAPDLRDVVIAAGVVYVSTMRTADVMRIASDGTVATHLARAAVGGTPSVAWRLTALPGGGIGAIMQAANESSIPPGPGGYGGIGCGESVTFPAVMRWADDGSLVAASILPPLAMPIDVAWAPDGRGVAVVAGEWKMPGSPQIAFLDQPAVIQGGGIPLDKSPMTPPPPPPPDPTDGGDDDAGDGGVAIDGGVPCVGGMPGAVSGQAVAAAFDASGKLYVQTRQPALLVVDPFAVSPHTITLSTVSRDDTGHAIFHSDQGGGVACASCHAEGQDDGRAWSFADVGPRRTPSMMGTIAGTAPYHWKGEEPDLPTLYSGALARMDGLDLKADQIAAESHWLSALPAPVAHATDAAAVARGKAVFSSAACDSCHAGAMGTNDLNMDVGTGDAFQVPPLVGVSWKPPFLHDGCAPTLLDALGTKCTTNGAAHGNAATLSASQLADLATYLQSL